MKEKGAGNKEEKKEMKGKEKGRKEREKSENVSTHKKYLICWEIHVAQWQCTPWGIMTILLLAVNCERLSMLAKGRYCSHNAPREASSSSFQDGCGQPPAEADKEPGLRAQEPSLHSPLQVWLSHTVPRLSPLVAGLPCPGDQGSLCASETNGCSRGCSPLDGGAWPPPAKEPLNEKRPRYPWQRPSLKVACPELHIF